VGVNFHGLELLTVSGKVMTPRPVTEHLVDTAIALVGDRPARIADVGTGSGAIALAIAAALPQAEVFATDTSAEAVLLARGNVARLGVADRVTVLRGNLLDPVPGTLDLVVANLPYLPLAERGRHPDLDGEPTAAVFSPGDGLDAYCALCSICRERLTADGHLAIQLRAKVLAASRDRLDALATRLGMDETGATGLEPATSGVTGRSWRFRGGRGSAGIPPASRAFRPRPCGDWRVRAGTSGDLVRDERGMGRCPTGKRNGIQNPTRLIKLWASVLMTD
jgi:SAM-dependent methyltransferase